MRRFFHNRFFVYNISMRNESPETLFRKLAMACYYSKRNEEARKAGKSSMEGTFYSLTKSLFMQKDGNGCYALFTLEKKLCEDGETIEKEEIFSRVGFEEALERISDELNQW